MLQPQIFKANDIRGLVAGEHPAWDAEGARALGAAFAAAFTANALHSTPVYDSLKERILDQRRRRRAAASPTEERS